MKKQRIELNKKLLLTKETITALSHDQRNEVKGGVLTNACAPTNDNNCVTGCVCQPTNPTWGLICGCNEKPSALCPAD